MPHSRINVRLKCWLCSCSFEYQYYCNKTTSLLQSIFGDFDCPLYRAMLSHSLTYLALLRTPFPWLTIQSVTDFYGSTLKCSVALLGGGASNPDRMRSRPKFRKKTEIEVSSDCFVSVCWNSVIRRAIFSRTCPYFSPFLLYAY